MQWSEMTSRQRDAWIAEWLGWTVDQRNEATVYAGYMPGGAYAVVPHYTTDEQAVRQVVERIATRGPLEPFLFALAELVQADITDNRGAWSMYLAGVLKVLRASPDQLCEAVWAIEAEAQQRKSRSAPLLS